MKKYRLFLIYLVGVLTLVGFNEAITQGASYSNDNLPSFGEYVGAGDITFPGTPTRVRLHALHQMLPQAAPPSPGSSSSYTVGLSYMLSLSTDDGTTWTTHDVPGALSFSAQYSSATSDERTFSTELLSMEVGGSSSGGVMLRESPTLQSTGTTKIKRVADGSYRIQSFFDIFTEISLDGGATWTRSATSSRVKLRNDAPAHLFASENFPPEGQFSSASGSPPVSFSQTTQLENLLVATNPSSSSLPPLGSSSTQTVSLNFTKISFSFDGGVTKTDYSANGEMQVRLSHIADVSSKKIFDTEMLSMSLSGGTLPGGVMVRESPTKASLGRTFIRTSPTGHMISSFFDIFTEISLDGGATWTPASEPVCLDFSSSPPSISAAANNFPPDGMDFTPQSYGVTTFENGAMIRNMEFRRIGINEQMPDAPLGVRSSVSSFFDVFIEISLDGLVWSPRSNVAPVMFHVTRQHDDGTSSFYDTEMLSLNIQQLGGEIRLRESPTRASTGRVSATLMSDGKFQVSSFFDIFIEISLDGGATWSPATAPTHLELTTATPSPRPVISSISPSSGPIGTIVTIEGSGFSDIPSENLVVLGDKTLPIKWSAPEVLRIVIPEGASTNGISVTVNGLSSLPPDSVFTVLPNVVSYLPNISDLLALDVATGDLDGDGLDEIMMLGKKEFKGHVTLLKRGGDGSLRVLSVISFPDLDLDSNFTGLLNTDSDGDGVVDYVAVSALAPKQSQGVDFGQRTLAIFENDPSNRGTLKSYSRVLLQQNRVLSSASIHDITGDDSLDVVLAYEAGGGQPPRFDVVKNIKRIDSTPARISTNFTVSRINDFAFADLDGDGDLDMACATNSGIQIFSNNQADFQFLSTQRVDETHPYSRIAVGDIDGDGFSDIVGLQSDSGHANVFFRSSSVPGTFSSKFKAGSDLAKSVNKRAAVYVADVDGDGHLDIICPGGSDQKTAALTAIGSIPFVGGVLSSTRIDLDDCDDGNNDKFFAVGKFNNDNYADFAFASCRSTTINPPIVSSISPDISPVGALITIEGDNLQDASSVKIGDFDATFIRESPTKLSVTVPLAARTFAVPHVLDRITITCPSGVCAVLKPITVSPVLVYAPPKIDDLQISFVQSGDVDGDGKDDAVMLAKENCCRGHVIIMKAYDDDTESRAMVTSFFYGEDEDCDGFSLADYDNDGHLDVCVVVSSASRGTTTFSILFGDVSTPGTFKQKQWLVSNFRSPFRMYPPNPCDLNGDGFFDITYIAAGPSGDSIVTLLNNPNDPGNFSSRIATATGEHIKDAKIVRRAGTSFFDIFCVTENGIIAYKQEGGRHTPFQNKFTIRESPTRRSLACGDLNGDGHMDMVVADDDSSVITMCINNGDRTYRVVTMRGEGTGMATGRRQLLLTDFNGDGTLDIGVNEPGVNLRGTQDVYVWKVKYNKTPSQDSVLTFEEKYISVADLNSDVNYVAPCDIDGDSIYDILVSGVSSSVVHPPIVKGISKTRSVGGSSIRCVGNNFSTVDKVSVCNPCVSALSFSALSDNELDFVLPNEFGNRFLTISNSEGIARLAQPITILAAPDMFVSVPPESLIITVSGKFVKPVKRGKKLYPNWTNLLEEVVVQGGFQPGATESDAAGGLRVGISHIFQSAPGKWKPIKDSAAVRAWVVVRGWDPKKNAGKNWSAIQKTLKNKEFEHEGIGRGLDSTGVPGDLKRKKLKGELKGLDPKKTSNKLFAELVALKFNIAASQLGKTPVGFGELIYDNDESILDEMSVLDISQKADVAMTYTSNPLYEDDGHDGINPLYDGLYTAIYQINRAFTAPLDTATFEVGKSLTLDGTVDLATVPFLKIPTGLFRPIVLNRTTNLTESVDDIEGMEDPETLPTTAKLYQNYPNPFNPTTTINFGLRENSIVSLKIYNTLGQQVASLFENESFVAGNQTVEFDATNLASGLYFYRLTVENDVNRFSETHKMILMK